MTLYGLGPWKGALVTCKEIKVIEDQVDHQLAGEVGILVLHGTSKEAIAIGLERFAIDVGGAQRGS